MSGSPPDRRTVLLMAAGGALALSGCEKKGAASLTGAMTLGKADAPVKVIEYASTACHVCAAWDAEVWPAFKAKYVDTGLVHYELREMLTGQSTVAAAGFLIARCAGRDRYFDVVRSLYRSQEEMVRTGDPRGVLLRTAQSAGLTQAQFEACVSDEDALVAVNDRHEQNSRVASEGTPTFVIGEEKLVGNVPLARLDAVIQPLLRQRRTG